MIDPQSIVDCKSRILKLFKEKGESQQLLDNLENYRKDAINKEIQQFQEKKTKLESTVMEDSDANYKRDNDAYLAKVEELKASKQRSLDKLEQKLSDSRSKYLNENMAPFESLNYFKTYKHEIEPVIRSIPLHTLYESVEQPKLATVKDVVKFNQSLNQISQLEHIKNINIDKHHDKLKFLLKPIEFLVDRFGEERRMPIEIGYFLILISLMSQYRYYLMPAVIGACGLVIYTRYRNTLLLRKFCSIFFQANKYETEIETQIKKIILAEYEPKLEAYKQRNKAKMNTIFDNEMSKLVKPDSTKYVKKLDLSTLEAEHKANIDNINLDCDNRMSSTTFKLKNMDVAITAELHKLNSLNEECKSILDTFDSKGVLPQYVHLGEVVNNKYNILYPYMYPTLKESMCVTYDDFSRDSAVDFVKYYVSQLWRYVEVGSVQLEIIDTKDFGNDITDLLVDDKLIRLHTDAGKIPELFTQATDELKRRGTTILRKYDTIEDYNKAMFEQDATLCPYIVYLNLNPTIDQLLNTSHLALIQQAGSRGILVINLISEDFFSNLKEQELVKFTQMFENHEYKLMFQNNSIVSGLDISEDETFTSIKLSKQKYVTFADTLLERLKGGTGKPLSYKDHKERNFPNLWTEIPIKNIEFSPGNINGEKDKPHTILLGDKNPHGLIAGTTGTGKSVALNSIIMSTAHKYSPDWVQMVALDFKGVELLTYGKPYALPHMRVVSATRDVDYVLSIFEDLVGEMEARNKLFTDILSIKDYVQFAECMQDPAKKANFWKKITDGKCKKLKTLMETPRGKRLIESMTANGKYPVLPRIMFIIDEFADMFLIDDDLKEKVTKAIKTLSKKARSCGIHMLFASQNMEGTVPEEVLEQFPLRICLPCSLNVSNALIGNPEAGKLPPFHAISNDKIAEKEKFNIMFKVAYSTQPALLDMIAHLHEEGKKLGYTKSIPIYDEDVKHEYDEFRSKLVTYTKLYDTQTYILGEPRVYQRINIPVTATLTYKERQNVVIVAKNKDLMDSIATIWLDNYSKKNTNTIFQTGDDEFLHKYDVEYRITNLAYCAYDQDCNILEESLKATLSNRKQQRNMGETLKPVYYILHATNSIISFGIDPVSADARDFIQENMLDLNKHQIFFVFMSTSAKSIGKLFPFVTHLITGPLDENDVGYLPEVGYKTIRNIAENQMFYINLDSGSSKSFKPYQVYKTEAIDEVELFS